jgi:hypothetical protein
MTSPAAAQIGIYVWEHANGKLARAGGVAVGSEPIIKSIDDRPQQGQ